MSLSDQIIREGDISARPGQLERLYEIAEKVKSLEALAKRYEDAPVSELVECCGHITLDGSVGDEGHHAFGLIGQRVRIVLDKEG